MFLAQEMLIGCTFFISQIMSHNASGKGSTTEPQPASTPPPPPQHNGEPQNTTESDDEKEKLKIDFDTIQQHHQKSNNSAGEDFVEIELDVHDSPVILHKLGKRFSRRSSTHAQRQREAARARKKKIIGERRKARENYREALHNTRDTITLVAVLIASFAYSTGVSPPGGVYQDGPLIGTAVAAKRTAFKVFLVCNNVALFTSLCLVLVLVSIIPFKRKVLTRMLAASHKVMWVSVSFMATAYVSACVVIVRPPSLRWPRGLDWTTAFLMSICAGSLGSVFVGLGVLLIKHRLMKRKWKKEKDINRRKPRWIRKKMTEEYYTSDEDDVDSSIISDMEISGDLGYHSY